MRDTTPEAAAAQAQAYRVMTGARRVSIACQMTQAVRAMAISRIKASNPSMDDAAVVEQLVWELYGLRR